MCIKSRYKAVKQTIIANINQYDIGHTVDLLAVSKKQSVAKIIQLYNLGHRKFAESYVQEAIAKIESLATLAIEWHFIGPIQSNKTKYIAQYFSWVQSVDSLKLLTRLNNQRAASGQKLNVLLQLKVGDEASKRGLSAEDLLLLTGKHQQFQHLNIRGLMSIPAPTTDTDKQMRQFSMCRDIFKRMQKIIPVDTLSMGMSNDLEAAIASGTTMVRVGTDLFGSRDHVQC